MKHLLLTGILISLFCSSSFAQKFIVCGKIADEKNKPVKEGSLQLLNNDSLYLGNIDSNGLYQTGPVKPGVYEVVIKSNKVTYIAHLELKASDPQKQFYNFKIAKNKTATLTKTTRDPYVQTVADRSKKKPDYDLPDDVHIVPLRTHTKDDAPLHTPNDKKKK